jgi:lipopolysaccharide/colanic/teichoic acid biosynthesis glycosyltransferase
LALKRFVDVCGSAIGLVLLSPILGILAILIGAKLGAPVIFAQDRPGRYGRIFRLYKFRTMTNECDAAGNLLPDSERLTPFGRFLRSTSLDEVPEFWNVLKGDMSLVGPRPLLMEYLDRYTPEQARRHEVRPGITGLAQISGRNELSWDDRLGLDVWYVDNWTIWLDVKILAVTVWKALRREGITAAGQATMSPFEGSSRRGGDV